MPKLSLSKRIQKYCQNHYPEWINGAIFEKLAFENGFKGSNASRRCREMASGSLSNGKTCPIVLERRETENGTVEYRSIPPKESLKYTLEDGRIKILNKWI